MFKKRWYKLSKTIFSNREKGFTLVEALVASLLLVMITGALLTGLGTTNTVLLRTDARETAKNLAETQLEYIKNIDYNPLATSYDTSAIIMPAHYSATNVVYLGSDVNHFNPVRDNNIQKIVITITGAWITYNLEGFKTR